MPARFHLTRVFPILWLLAAVTIAAGPLPAANPPNIVLFYIDGLGWSDLGCQGSTFYETPHIDRLAGEGIAPTAPYPASRFVFPPGPAGARYVAIRNEAPS